MNVLKRAVVIALLAVVAAVLPAQDIYYKGSRICEIAADGDVYFHGSRVGEARGVRRHWGAGFFFFRDLEKGEPRSKES